VTLDAPNNQVWGENNLSEVGNVNVIAQSTTAKYDKDADYASPLNIAVTVEDTSISTPTRIVVFGDEDFSENIYAGQGANSDLMLNSVDWVAHQDQLINLTPKDIPYRFISVPSQPWVMNAILLASVLLLPGSFMVLGGLVWYNRRKHR
jgi:ABC-type uncharacterized transport system involved in gliding motility auxiliary subunit